VETGFPKTACDNNELDDGRVRPAIISRQFLGRTQVAHLSKATNRRDN
jgi:hypothetical protein